MRRSEHLSPCIEAPYNSQHLHPFGQRVLLRPKNRRTEFEIWPFSCRGFRVESTDSHPVPQARLYDDQEYELIVRQRTSSGDSTK